MLATGYMTHYEWMSGWMRNVEYISELSPFTHFLPTPSSVYLLRITSFQLLTSVIVYPPLWCCFTHFSLQSPFFFLNYISSEIRRLILLECCGLNSCMTVGVTGAYVYQCGFVGAREKWVLFVKNRMSVLHLFTHLTLFLNICYNNMVLVLFNSCLNGTIIVQNRQR